MDPVGVPREHSPTQTAGVRGGGCLKTLEVARHIASLPPLATRLVKESLLRGMDIPNLSDASLVDLYRFMALELTEDKAEGHTAWREKRPPVFHGR